MNIALSLTVLYYITFLHLGKEKISIKIILAVVCFQGYNLEGLKRG